MEIKGKKIAFCALIAAGLAAVTLNARPDEGQGSKDDSNIVRLLQAKQVQMITGDDGKSLRKSIEATYFHNGTYLICDTAYWWVDDNIINAVGNVSLSQDNTILTSETLDYYVDDNLAKFRGGIVQLTDKDNNTLRTKILDYNTADSIAVFTGGAAMKDKDGQIIESQDGTYESKKSLFTFKKDVNMFTDSVFIKTTSLLYHSDLNMAVFDEYTDFWKERNMLSAKQGWYKRDSETFFFTGSVHGTSQSQEVWTDSLYFYRDVEDVLMLGNVQLQDSTHNTSAVSKYLFYQDSLKTVTLRDEAAVAIATRENDVVDTLYFGADTLIYYTMRYCDISDEEKAAAAKRLDEILTDPVGQYRKKAQEEAERQRLDALEKKNIEEHGGMQVLGKATLPKAKDPDEETPAPPAPADSASMNQPADSSAVVTELPDTTRYGYAVGIGNVKLFRQDLQVKAQLMKYCDLDSIARFYEDPLVWNEGRRQYYADSIATLIRNNRVDRASLMSEAFVVTQENDICYDQIKGAEIMAYFDSTSALKRFDALGGAKAIFYLEDNNVLSTVNKVECKMLSGTFVDGVMDRVYYYDTPKNDAFPLAQFPKTDREIKGFKWNPDLRPSGKADITTLRTRPSERRAYNRRPKARFKQTEIYFPGYMKTVYEGLEEARRNAGKKRDTGVKTLDSLSFESDSTLAVSDSLKTPIDSLATQKDSLKAPTGNVKAPEDTLTAVTDSLGKVEVKPRESWFSTLKKKLEAYHKAQVEKREKRWAELDEKDRLKAEKKKEEAIKKKRENTRKALEKIEKQEKKDQETLDRYIKYYREQKEKKDGKNRKEISAVRVD